MPNELGVERAGWVPDVQKGVRLTDWKMSWWCIRSVEGVPDYLGGQSTFCLGARQASWLPDEL